METAWPAAVSDRKHGQDGAMKDEAPSSIKGTQKVYFVSAGQ
jgi:hypothetical protein